MRLTEVVKPVSQMKYLPSDHIFLRIRMSEFFGFLLASALASTAHISAFDAFSAVPLCLIRALELFQN